MGFETISEEGQEDYEVWTCDECGHSIVLAGVGGDVAECPACLMIHEEAEDRWIDLHSINCVECGELADERDCIPAEDDEGEICPKCQ